MNFFDYIKNDAFFKPLTLKYRRVYYDCIQILIDKTKELPVLYESDAKDSITAYLKNAGINEVKKDISSDINAVEEIEAGESGTELQSSGILSLFRECGWLLPREIGRNGEYIANISIDCRKLMDFLRKMTEKSGEGMMSNRIFSMYEIIKSAFEEDSVRRERPYTNILVPLIDNETELKNELTDLKDSISSIMKAVIIFQDINSFGQFIMKDEMLDRFFSEYFFVKNNGLIPAQLSFIKAKLRILRQEEACEKIIKECSEKLQLNYEEARERVERYFAELQYFLSVEYESNMELIDSRINNYYNLANTRIMLMASNGVRLESVINDFLNTVSKMTEEEQNVAMEKVADCIRITSLYYLLGGEIMSELMRLDEEYRNWIQELGDRYRTSQIKASIRVNNEMLMYYWSVGKDITERRADSKWGNKFFQNMSMDMSDMIPNAKGFSPTNLRYMMRFYGLYKDIVIVPQVGERLLENNGNQIVPQVEED